MKRPSGPLTKEELEEASRLNKPENRAELELLIKDCLKGPGNPIIEKLAFETLEKVRRCQKTLDSLKRQLKEEEN